MLMVQFDKLLRSHNFWEILFLEVENEDILVFNEDCFIVKIPFKYSKPLIKVYKDNKLFNYYHLAKGMEIICLLNLSKLWVNFKNEISYNLNVKEILVI